MQAFFVGNFFFKFNFTDMVKLGISEFFGKSNFCAIYFHYAIITMWFLWVIYSSFFSRRTKKNFAINGNPFSDDIFF